MAAGEAQLTDLPGGIVTRPGADQDGLTRKARTQPARTRPASRTSAVLPLPGAGLAYEVTGDGPAVVLVHGFALDMRMWEPQVEHLAARYRVVRRIPGAEYRVVAGAGHMVNMEQPAAVNDLLSRFLAGLPAPATEGLSEQTEELTEQGDEQWSR